MVLGDEIRRRVAEKHFQPEEPGMARQPVLSPDEVAYYQQQEEMLRQQRMQEEEYYRQQMMQQQQLQQAYEQQQEEEAQEEDDEISYRDLPIQRAIEINKNPTPKGYYETIIGGTPVDLHALENYLVATSPFAIKTLMRFNNAEIIEDIKNYATKGTGKKKIDMKFIMILILAIGLGCLGVFVMMFMPQIMATFQGGF